MSQYYIIRDGHNVTCETGKQVGRSVLRAIKTLSKPTVTQITIRQLYDDFIRQPVIKILLEPLDLYGKTSGEFGFRAKVLKYGLIVNMFQIFP